ncbi:MAG: type II secretory pathway protein ExeA [Acidobacteria bacterium]|nr:MAG: type II secretory pathway protein ExeA [Acidobacteriota bacterium]
MYEEYYGFAEKPFSLTPDPKYLYRSQSHADAFDLLQYAIRRREGFVVVTGDIGTGKTTLCRALLEQIDRTTFTALVLNPFLSEEDLLKRILQDFGVISREEVKAGRLAGVTKQELIDALYDFLLALIPLKAGAVLIIDEAQNLPLTVIEQIRILSNLETDKEKLLQIILVGQLNLGTLLRSPELRQLDQRVSIRYELKPLDEESVAAYVAHRLTIAGGSASVAFLPKALAQVHRLSGGIPRLINLICDRALLAGYSVRTNRITPDMVIHAAASLDVPPPAASRPRWVNWRASLVAGAAVALLASAISVGATMILYQRFVAGTVTVSAQAAPIAPRPVRVPRASNSDRPLPPAAALTILVGSYPVSGSDEDRAASGSAIRSLTEWLEASGFRVYYAEIDLGPRGHWQRVLAGAYTDPEAARADELRLKSTAIGADARIVTAGAATGLVTAAREPDEAARPSGIEP